MYEEKKMEDKTDTLETKTSMYSLSLRGDGIALDREIDESTALDVISLVMSSGGGTVIDAGGGVVVRHNVPRPRRGGQSLREYLDEVQAKRNPDKILAVGKYISNETGKNFTRDDVKSRFQTAAERVPGNYGRDFWWTMKNGWIAEATDARGEYYVTDTGDKALEAKFSDDVKKKTGITKGRRGGKRGKKQNGSGDS